MPLEPTARCPGSGLRMVPRTYEIRKIEAADREENERRIKKAEERGDHEWAQLISESFKTWEREQGQTNEQLACAVCGSTWLMPTRSGATRPHTRHDTGTPTWGRVRMLRKEIKVLQEELDRALEHLEPE